jgi:hypothetical protein
MKTRRFLEKSVMHLMTSVAAGILLTLLAVPATAGPVVINFETLPALPVQPGTFFAAGSMQTYSLAGVFSITGGVVLGNPTGLIGFPIGGSAPNTYGTSDLGHPTLLSAITLMFPASAMVGGVTGVLFNGQPIAETYQITAFSGATPLVGQTLSNIPAAASTADFRTFSINSSAALPITSVIFNAPADFNLNGWDFFVDTITVSPIPEPSSVLLILGGAAVMLALRRTRSR